MVIFTFDTTHHALWAEEIARDAEIAHEVVPAPAEANARCNLALATLEEGFGMMEAELKRHEVPFGIYRLAKS